MASKVGYMRSPAALLADNGGSRLLIFPTIPFCLIFSPKVYAISPNSYTISPNSYTKFTLLVFRKHEDRSRYC